MSQIYEALKRAEKEFKSPGTTLAGNDTTEALFQPAPMSVVTEVSGPAPVATPAEEATQAAAEDPLAASPAKVRLLEDVVAAHWIPSPKLIRFADRDRGSSVGAEQFRRLRSRLYQMRDKQHDLKRVLVSSALPAEGKTFVSANLAQVLARHGRTRVLLVDADLRKPRLHTELGASATPGLSDYLQGRASEIAVMQRGPNENLYFISGGSTVENPAELVSGTRFQKLMEHAATLFDWVIVDSSPVVPISDAALLCRHCDGVLLVALAESTPFDLVQKAKDEFRNSTVLGVLLNQVVEMSSYKPYYYNAYRPAAESVRS